MAISSQINVGIGTTVLYKGLNASGIDGIGHYTKELLDCLSNNPNIQLQSFTLGSVGKHAVGNVTHQLPRFSLGTLPSLILGRSYYGSQKLLSSVDLIHATDHLIPRCQGVPVVATVMDAIPLAHPEWVNTRFSALKNAIWKKSVGFADRVITISEHSKNDLIEHFGIPEDRISVTPLGVDERWFERPSLEYLAAVRVRYKLPDNFFVFVGTLQPRKNISRMIDAHCALPDTIRKSHPLIIIGRAGWQCSDILDRFKPENTFVRWLKYVSGDDLPSILRCASGLVFPSLHEGFGLPVLEAFAAELPVITSNVTSLPEVAGNAALLINPYDVQHISWAMQQLIEDSATTNRLRLLGLNRAKEFTWKKTAQTTVSVYRQAIDGF
jgi:glycosyltransferase involved in cell wall biosynthesis